MRVTRLLLGAIGVVLVLVGVWHLVLDRPDVTDLVSIGLYSSGEWSRTTW